ncbi:ATP-binding protein [Litchfieldia alkalitelluris]|uniref:ATP-binding protein n=1 Tax=Litchfieldia alkalitelluris TaxID=304268 RepID=UPI0009982445|nr:ATP-binding protein [Litchfieldia alkalitelluris]
MKLSSRFKYFFRKSLARQFAGLLIGFFIFSLLGAICLLSYQHYVTEENSEKNRVLEKKETLGQRLDHTFNMTFFDMRGYFAYGNSSMKESALSKKNSINNITEELGQLVETEEDLIFYNEVLDFTSYYFENVVQLGIQYYENGQTEELIQLAQGGATSKINDFQQLLQNYRLSQDQQLEANFEELVQKITNSQFAFVVFIGLMLILLLFISRAMVIQIGLPLQKLAAAATNISDGKELTKFEQTNRDDELGILSRAFEKMVLSIQNNEQDLTAQNEELIAQQDELQVQQVELENALSLMEARENDLKKRNELIKHLSNSLDKKKVLTSIVENMCSVLEAEQGIIVLLDTKDHAAFGISNTGIQQFLEFIDSGHVNRAVNQKEVFMIRRETSSLENGYHERVMCCCDLYIPIISFDNQVSAIMVYTRFDSPFTEKEVYESESFSKQVAISLENLKLFSQTEDQQIMTQDILNTILEGVQFVDKNGSILQVNEKMCDILNGGGPKSLINQTLETWLDLLSNNVVDQAQEIRGFITRAVKSDLKSYEHTMIYHTIAPIPRVVQVYCQPLYSDDEKLGTVFVHRDITKEFEVDQMKSEFVSTVSHELRTPLASMLGFTELMLEKELKPDRQKKYLTAIYHEAKRLTALINDFLDVQRIESGKQIYDKKFENVVPIIKSVIENQKVNALNHSIELQQETEHTYILGDKDKLFQVFNNLLNNAIKYSPDGGLIKIIIEEKANLLSINISDEGLGIPKEAMQDLFKKFYRVDNSDRRKIGGTGLGLSIVKEIVRVHEGVINVVSDLGKGTTFTLDIPLIKDHTSDEEVTLPEGSLRKLTNIVLVEDDDNLASLLETELKDSGFFVTKYRDGFSALEAIKQSPPDAVVLDIMLEEKNIDGWDILKSLKQHSNTSNIPIFISSALEEKEKGISLGASGYLVKPYRPGKLTKTILQALLNRESSGSIHVPESE